jgi:hypothetical protein
LALASPLVSQQGSDEPLRAQEYEVKAAFLYSFVKFVQWPRNALSGRDSIEVAVLGRDPFGTRLDETLAGKTADGRPFRVKRVRTAREAENADILFLTSRMEESPQAVLAALAGRPILTISDTPELDNAGAVILMVVEDRRVRFDVDLAAATRNGLTLSSHLLRLARRVEEAPKGQ